MIDHVNAADLAALIAEQGDDLALLDVREIAEFNLAHVAGSCSLPRRLLEFRVQDLVPWTGTSVIICDDDGRRAALAAQTLAGSGYARVSVLSGGLNRWVTEGYPTEWGVNVPSKDFGERVLFEQQIPEIDPDQLAAWLDEGKTPVILDSRTPEEHQRACIPGSRSMPGAELGLRMWDLVEDPQAPVVVHCAGRTRSIIGAAALKRLGLSNVYALKNGTMGWQLAGRDLERGSTRLDLPEPDPESRQRADSAARAVAEADGVCFVDSAAAAAILASATDRNVHAFDVRTRAEFAKGHIAGFVWVPGGQAVQATDNYVAVGSATLLFACDGITRAAMTASWFRQMGFQDVNVLDGGTSAWQAGGAGLETGSNGRQAYGLPEAREGVTWVGRDELARRLDSGDLTVLHVGASDEFSRAHIPGSRWLSRSWLELRVGEYVPGLSSPVVVTCADGLQSAFAAATLTLLGYRQVESLEGGLAAWDGAGLAVETGLTRVIEPPNDVLPVQRSYAEMLNYLRWEEALGEKYAGEEETVQAQR